MQIREIFAEYTSLIEPLSLDEAYLDVTENLKGIEYATRIAREIRERIFEQTALTASAGVSYNKFLAKMASDQRKPNGMFVITPDQGPAFVESLPVAKFHGIGPRTAERMKALDIETGADLRARSLEFLQQTFGKAGTHYYWISRGVDERPVQAHRVRKSVGAENTFSYDLTSIDEMIVNLEPIIDKVWSHLERLQLRGRTITLKVKYQDFQQITRSRTGRQIADKEAIKTFARMQLAELQPFTKGVRLLGVTVSGFDEEFAKDTGLQLTLGF